MFASIDRRTKDQKGRLKAVPSAVLVKETVFEVKQHQRSSRHNQLIPLSDAVSHAHSRIN